MQHSKRFLAVRAAALIAALMTDVAPAGAQVDQLVQPGGTVSVVHGAAVSGPLTVSIDGVRRGPAIPFAAERPAELVSAGIHEIGVRADSGTATAAVEVGTGCTVVVVAMRPGGARQPLALRPFSECPVPGPAPDRASLRLIVASASVGPITATAGAEQSGARPGEASSRLSLAAGRTTVVLRREGAPAPWRSVPVDAVPGHAYDLVVLGDGDTPVTTALFDVAGAPPDPPAPGTVIPMGGGAVEAGRGGLMSGLCAVISLAAVLALGRRRRALLALACVALLVAGSACEPSAGDAPGPVATTIPAGPGARVVPGAAVTPATPPVAKRLSHPERITGPGVDAAVRAVANDQIAGLLYDLDPADVAWLRGTSVPGDRGFAVLAGHVAWGGKDAVFGHLPDLRAGDVFRVVAADGRVSTWEVEGAVVVAKGALPAWLSSAQAVPRLALVTCDGIPVDRSHPDNLVVVARPA